MRGVLEWKVGKVKHYGVATGNVCPNTGKVEVEYTHSKPASNVQAGRLMWLDPSKVRII